LKCSRVECHAEIFTGTLGLGHATLFFLGIVVHTFSLQCASTN
jgi:hypothetical protein